MRVGVGIVSGVIVGIGVIVGTGVKSGVTVIAGVGDAVRVVSAGVGVAGGVGVVNAGVAVVPGVTAVGVGVPVAALGGSGVGPPGVAVAPPPGKPGVPVAMGVAPGPIGVGVGAEGPLGVGEAFGLVTTLSPPHDMARSMRETSAAYGPVLFTLKIPFAFSGPTREATRRVLPRAARIGKSKPRTRSSARREDRDRAALGIGDREHSRREEDKREQRQSSFHPRKKNLGAVRPAAPDDRRENPLPAILPAREVGGIRLFFVAPGSRP